MNRSTNPRRFAFALDALESRVSPVGFLEGPAAVPVHLALSGVARGSEVASTQGNLTTARISAEGSLQSLGATRVYGRLQIVGNSESGVLVLQSAHSDSTLDVRGTFGGPLAFAVANGRATVPNTTWDYALETGAGTVSIASHSTRGGTAVSLTFAH